MIILDSGHGAIINGKYQTKGKRAYQPKLSELIDDVLGYDSKGWFYEGVYNRFIRQLVYDKLILRGLEAVKLYEGAYDMPLKKRCDRVNKKYTKKDILISLHSDAFSNPNSNGSGVYYYSKKSLAYKFNRTWSTNGLFKNRGVRQANFYILRHTKPQALLIEIGFMTNYNDCYKLLTQYELISDKIVDAIISISK